MTGHYVIRNNSTNQIYKEMALCGGVIEKEFKTKISALMYLYSHGLSEKEYEVIFVRCGKCKNEQK